MRIVLPLAAAAILALAAAGCQNGTGASASTVSAEGQFSAERIKAHVSFLADDLLEGREAGTRGHEVAARYVASQFELLGVAPAGEKGTYFQNVDLLEIAPTGATPTMTITTPRGQQTLKHHDKVLVRGAVTGGVVDIRAPLVFVGYGIQDNAVGYDDYAGLDVRNKIVVALSDSPKGLDSEVGAHLRNEQGRVAAAHQAAALVSVMTRRSAAAFPWDVVLRFADEPSTTWVRKDGTAFDATDGLKAGVIIDPAVASILFEGAPQTLTQILDEADRDGGRPKGFPLKANGTIKVESKLRRFSSPEVIGVIEGSDPALKGEYVALMAHADHIGTRRSGAGDRINNGALDNAAGTATLIEVARAFATAPQRQRRSVLVVANTAEEKGLLGAEYYAHYPTVPIERIVAGIDLDMPMLFYDFTDVVAYGAAHSTLDTMFQKAAAGMGVKLSPDPMPEQAIFVRSDHYALVKVGIPAVMLATGMANGGQAAWDKFFANNYHQPSDDLSQPIVWSAGAKFAELNYRVVRELANADAAPRWYANDYFGNLFAAKASKVERPRGTP
jgi:Zn-dependent M28 family amino/carboxypeptidase